jgi:D-glycerate 3-kinase
MSQVKDCFSKVKKECFKFILSQETKKDKFKNKDRMIKSFLIPISFWVSKRAIKKKPLIIGLAGGQGSGKTTISSILSLILKKYFKLNVFKVSIDDFYKTRRDRRILSKSKHPLLVTRGVPGTHDTDLILKFFKKIKSSNFKKLEIPKFDKAIDDRCKKGLWYKIKSKPDVVIFEGWCVGAKPQSYSLIKKPINDLEKNEDKDMIWRKHVNNKLKKEYKKIFSKIDHFIFIKIPNFKAVFKWRSLQESKIKKNSDSNKKIMSYSELKRFIMFYERITLQMIKDLSKSASMLMTLKKNQEVKKVFFRS